MENKPTFNLTKRKKRYNVESKFYAEESSMPPTHKSTYTPKPEQPKLFWETLHEIDQFNDEQEF